jgi:predicted negative regulator of RcsB-dependent stress response
MESVEILKFLISQGVLGVITYILYKRYDKCDNEKNELAKQVISVILKYEFQSDQDKNNNTEIKKTLQEIKDMLNGVN